MTRIFSSIKWRFILIYIVVVLLTFGAVITITSAIVENKLLQRKISESMQSASDLSAAVTQNFSANNAKELYTFAVEQSEELGGRVLIVDKYGIVQTDSFSLLNGYQLSTNKEVVNVLTGAKEADYGFHKISGSGSSWTGYYVSAITQNAETKGAVLFSQSIQDVVAETNAVRLQYMGIYAISMAVTVVILYFFAQRQTEPLVALRESTLAISHGDFSKRVAVSGKGEIAQLGDAFNYMSDRVENMDRQSSEFVSNASHELKTPLSSVKILTESLIYQDDVPKEVYKEFMEEINREVDRMTNLINDLLLLTKLQSEEEGAKKELIAVDVLVEETMDMLVPLAQKKGIAMQFDAGFSGTFRGFGTNLSQAVRNLLENAIKYTQPGGEVGVKTYRDGDFLKIEVKDNGEGIPKEELGNIFERFYRVDKARSRDTAMPDLCNDNGIFGLWQNGVYGSSCRG